MNELRAALDAWRTILGDERVCADRDTRERHEQATLASSVRVWAVLAPRSVEEVSACVKVAATHGVPVYPISRGRNWGLGSRLPTTDAVVIDLSSMQRIVAYDEEMAWVTLEPGVSFRTLHAFLAERESRLFASVTGSSPEASVLGNALERGDGTGSAGDRWRHVCALEAVLSTGEVVRTGFARMGDGPLAALHREGVGPSLDGLLAQSNMAVVTRATVWLTPLPRSVQVMRFSVRDEARLAPLVDAVRRLRLEGTFSASVAFWNDLRARSAIGSSPDAGLTARDPDARWHALTGIYAASELQGRAHRERAVDVLAPLVDAWHIEERVGEARAGHELLWETEPAFEALQGVPHERALRSAYWRKPTAPTHDLDPDRDRCGLVWVCVAVPLRGNDVVAATQDAERVLVEHGFDPLVAFVTPQERTAYVVPTIAYDRDTPDDDARALRCHEALLDAFEARGCLPYRLSSHAMHRMPSACDDTDTVMARVRRALDPAGVIAPGRYTR
jgi:4-cresol dehydrogenase (hydroxylating)